MKKNITFSLTGVVLLVGGYLLVRTFFLTGTSEDMVYEFAKVVKKDISITLPVDGKVVFDTWELSFQNSGVVERIDVSLGETVKKGQVLAQIDGSKTATQLAQSSATLQSDILDMDRLSRTGVDYKLKKDAYEAAQDTADAEDDLYDEIVDQNGEDSTQALAQRIKVKSADANVDNLKRQLEQLKKSYESARYQVDKSQAALAGTKISAQDDTIISPVSGAVVAQIHGSTGKVISSSQNSSDPFITLADPKHYWFEAYVEDVEALKLIPDMNVRMVLDAYPDRVFDGAVVFVSPVAEVDQNDLSTYKAIFTIDGGETKMLGDMTGSAEVVLREARDVLSVPTSAVHSKNGSQYVIVRKNGLFEERMVTAGFTDGKSVEIQSGLSAGEEVVIVK